jgi:hypothetical protein
MIKIQSVPKVYAVEPGGVIRWVETQEVAEQLYGITWNERIRDVNPAFFPDYTEGDSVSTASHPTGSLIQYEGETFNYYVEDGEKRLVPSDVFNANLFKDGFVVKGVSSSLDYPAGANLGASSVADMMFP